MEINEIEEYQSPKTLASANCIEATRYRNWHKQGEINLTELYKKLQQQKASVLDIANHYHAINVRVFGSVLRGEEREDSDIDLLVDFLPGSTLLDQVGLIDALSAKLGRKVDVVSERALNKYLRQRVLQEAVAL
jgi:uncharacterized protein